MLELASRYRSLVSELQDKEPSSSIKEKTTEEVLAAEKLLFIEMAEIALWGNATDLSLLTSLTYDDIQKLQGSEARKKAEANIVVNDISDAYGVLKHAQKTSDKEMGRTVDIVLDNSGFELYVDLLFAGYLLASNLATRVVLHAKAIPWFVSDVTPPDFAALLNALAEPQAFFCPPSEDGRPAPAPLSTEEEVDVTFLFKHLARIHEEGKLVLRAEAAWTGPGSFWRLPFEENEGLWQNLKESELVIYKGDLNYRKLTGDVCDLVLPWLTLLLVKHVNAFGCPGSSILSRCLTLCLCLLPAHASDAHLLFLCR